MKIAPKLKTTLIVGSVVVVCVLINWLGDEFINPSVKAGISVTPESITIQNLNRSAWTDPVFRLDDESELKIKGSWPAMSRRTLRLADFRHTADNRPHTPQAKTEYEILVMADGFKATLIYNLPAASK